MKVKMLVGRAGVDFSNAPGDIVDLPEKEAKAYILNGAAEPVKSTNREKAVLGETKTNKRTKKRAS